MFARFADWCVAMLGHPLAFALSLAACLLWGAAGPLFGYSDTWQLVINTATTVITFLMLFVLQHSQNKDTAEIKSLLRSLAEDLPEVDEDRAKDPEQ